jgi:DNA repair protein RadA/Sms
VAASLEKHLGLRLSDQDLYVNVAGGIRINEVGVELALGCAIYSARTGIPLPAGVVIAGELSLTGEIRPVRRLAGRIKTAKSLGFDRFIGPEEGGETARRELIAAKKEWTAVRDIKSAIKVIFNQK